MPDDFAVSVKRWVDKANGQGQEVFQDIAIEALNRIKELTPVRTGYLKAGWQIGVNGEVALQAGATQDVTEEVAKAKIGDKIFIYNPVVYASRVNFGFHGADSLGRVYKENGAHMLEQTMMEIPAIARSVLVRFKK